MSRQKTAAGDKEVAEFSAWLMSQPWETQRAVIVAAKRDHGYEPSAKAFLSGLKDVASDGDPTFRLIGKIMLYTLTTSKLKKPFDGDARIPLRKGRISKALTAAEAALVLDISRATFLRKAESKSFRDFLGYTATNTRNGRYSLERVIDHYLQGLNAFKSPRRR